MDDLVHFSASCELPGPCGSRWRSASSMKGISPGRKRPSSAFCAWRISFCREDLDYAKIKGLSKEAVDRPQQGVRPISVGQASRISGVTPADISVL